MTPADFRTLRLNLGMSQKELAEVLCIPEVTVWRWEKGAMPIQHPRILMLAMERLALEPR